MSTWNKIQKEIDKAKVKKAVERADEQTKPRAKQILDVKDWKNASLTEVRDAINRIIRG